MSSITEKNILRMLICVAFALVLLFSVPQTESKAALLDPEGSSLVDITACTGLYGHYTAIAGNVAHPMAAFDSNTQYISYLSESEDTWNKDDHLNEPSRVVITKYDGTNCTTPLELTSNTKNPGNPSHNAPSVFVDANEYVYVTYGLGLSSVNTKNGPWVRRSTNPGNISAFETEERMRLFQGAELNGFTMKDGSVLFTGTDMHGRFSIGLPYESSSNSVNYLHSDGQQVVTFGWGAEWSITGNCEANHFSKAVFFEGVGTDDNIYVAWGDGRGGSSTNTPCSNDEDYKHYSQDSHEVFFAYSDDKGATWYNLEGTKSKSAVDCWKHDDGWHNDSTQPCRKNPYAGILIGDSDFRISTTRQREHREIWADPSGAVYIAFAKSNWCDSGLCDDPNTKVSTNPGSLMMLKFNLGDSPAQVEEFVVNDNVHTFIGGIRKDKGSLYIWAHENATNAGGSTNDIYEYVSTDDGDTWSRTQISPSSGVGTCNRTHGETYNPFLKNSVRILFQCRVLDPVPSTNAYSHLFLYTKSFDHSTDLPTGWINADIGSGVAAGDTSYWEDSTFLVHGAGADIYGTSDKFRYVYQEVAGDFEIVTQVLEVEHTHNLAQAGLMIRESTAADSKHASMVLRGDDYTQFKYRATTGGTTDSNSSSTLADTSYWLKLKRDGNTIYGYTSSDGVTWTLADSQSITMNNNVLVGMAVISYDDLEINTSTFAHTEIIGGSTLPVNWNSQDVGSVGIAGSAGENSGVYTVNGSGTDIWGAADEFHFAYTDLSGDGSVVAKVTSVENTNFYALAGVMIRETTAAGSKHVMMGVRPETNGINMKQRTSTDGTTTGTSSGSLGAPLWVKLERTGDTFKGYYSSDGVSWTLVDTYTVSMNANVYAGLAVTARDNTALNTSTFENVTVDQSSDTEAPTAPGNLISTGKSGTTVDLSWDASTDNVGVTEYIIYKDAVQAGTTSNTSFKVTGLDPSTAYDFTVTAKDAAGNESNSSNVLNVTTSWFLNQDIGSVGVAGSASEHNGVVTVNGSGTDIWGAADEFHFAYTDLSGDGSVVAKVTSVENTNFYALAGVMIRETTATGSKHVMMGVRPETNGINMKQRTSTDGTTTGTSSGSLGAPLWVKLERTGDTFKGYYSSDGISWTLVDTYTVSMNVNVYAGLAVTAKDNAALNTSTFENVSIEESVNGLSSTDIGSVGIAGSSSYSAGVYTLNGSGTDIWGTADEFHFAYTDLSGDGSVVAKVTSVENTNFYALAGVMIRETTAAGSKHVMMGVRPETNGINMKQRTSTDGTTTGTSSGSLGAPLWVKLERTGDTFKGYHSSDGLAWTLVDTYTVSMNSNVYAGLAVTTRDNAELNTSTFENVTINE